MEEEPFSEGISMKKPPHYPMRPEEVLSEEEIREIEENNGSLYPPVTAASLDKAECGTPGCTEDHSVLYLNARCHPESGTRARYIKKDRVLIIDCLECGRRVAYIAVAP
jgi:hypothetical protein